jgi:putative transposase
LVRGGRDWRHEAAKRFFRRLLKGLQYVPRVIVTDKLRSYGVAQRRFCHVLRRFSAERNRADCRGHALRMMPIATRA